MSPTFCAHGLQLFFLLTIHHPGTLVGIPSFRNSLPLFFPNPSTRRSLKGNFPYVRKTDRDLMPLLDSKGCKWVRSATVGFLYRAPPLSCARAPAPSPVRERSGARHATRSSALVRAAARQWAPRGRGRGHPERLPMSELQKASWGWLGEHVHASAPQSPRLQLPRSTTSPSQGVIVAGAAAPLSKVAASAAGGPVVARARPPGRAGQLWAQAPCPPSAQRDGKGRGEAAGRWRTTPQAGELSERRSGSWSRR